MSELEDHPAPRRTDSSPKPSSWEWWSQDRNPGLLHPGHFAFHSCTHAPSESQRSRSEEQAQRLSVTWGDELSSGEVGSISKVLQLKAKCSGQVVSACQHSPSCQCHCQQERKVPQGFSGKRPSAGTVLKCQWEAWFEDLPFQPAPPRPVCTDCTPRPISSRPPPGLEPPPTPPT